MSYDYNNYILTSEGFKPSYKLSNKDYVYDANSRLGRVTYRCTYPITDPSQFTILRSTVDTLPVIVKNDVYVDTVGKTLIRRVAPFQTVVEDDWIFHPWINREQLSYRTSVDLSKTATNFYDVKHLYLFNNRVLKIAEDLGISQKAVKEILIREAAEYEEYIPLVYDYIKTHFDIDSTPYEGSIESFKEFKHFVKDQFVFKMNRYMDIDINFVAFVISTLTRCKINKTSPTNKTFVYELSYRFETEKDKELISKLESFSKTLDVKYEIKQTKNITYINIFNKPLFDFVQESLVYDLKYILDSTKECQEYFVEHLFNNVDKIIGNRSMLLQVKEIFLYHKKVVGISEAVEGYAARPYEDDLSELDSNLIVSDDGYFTRVVIKAPLPGNEKLEYTYVETQDRSTSYMYYTKK